MQHIGDEIFFVYFVGCSADVPGGHPDQERDKAGGGEVQPGDPAQAHLLRHGR